MGSRKIASGGGLYAFCQNPIRHIHKSYQGMFRHKLLAFFAIPLFVASLFFFSQPASAHQSGCHRWHSCPSDSGSYVCGDTGYCSQCSDNYYCKNGDYDPGRQSPIAPPVVPAIPKTITNKPSPAPTKPRYFIGVPRNYTDLSNCYIVGTKKSLIYHLKGSSYIKAMVPTGKECFASEAGAIEKEYRKAKLQ